MNKGALGLAYAAKKVVLGADYVVTAMRDKKVHLVLLASDASDNTKKKISDKAKTYNVLLVDIHSSYEISQALGKNDIKVVGITDKGFSMLLK